MEVNFSDYINDAIRILILLNTLKDRKSVKVTENRIKLFDYFLKFPSTMFEDELPEHIVKWNFDEYYSFFHWQPDLIRYRQTLNFLQAKGLIERKIENSLGIYVISDLGVQAINSIDTPFKKRMDEIATMYIPNVAKLSDTKIEQIINEKSKKGLQRGSNI